MAEYQSSGTLYYRHSDWQGSARLVSSTTNTVYADSAYGPFGEPYAQSGSSDIMFTGMNQDTYGNIYDFPAREYGIQGRWPSPDPAGLAAAGPGNPQSWNRYAYANNSPLNSIDPLGLTPNPMCAARSAGPRAAYNCHNGFDTPDGGGGGDGFETDNGDQFDQQALCGGGGPGFCDIAGNTIFGAMQGAPGTYITWTPGQTGFSWGFSIPAWESAMAQQDAQMLGNSSEAYYAQLGATVAALQVALQVAGVKPQDIANLIDEFIQGNSSFDPNTAQLGGGNFDFQAQSLGSFLNCANERCDEGGLGTIDYSHNDGTLHLDTADPFNFPGGTFLHTAVDVFLGNIFYFVIPR